MTRDDKAAASAAALTEAAALFRAKMAGEKIVETREQTRVELPADQIARIDGIETALHAVSEALEGLVDRMLAVERAQTVIANDILRRVVEGVQAAEKSLDEKGAA